MTIRNGLVFAADCRFHPLNVETDGNIITALSRPGEISGQASPASSPEVDAAGCYVLPGLTDIHFHGCAGHECYGSSPEEAAEHLRHMGEYELSVGVTSICPTAMSLPSEALFHICRGAALFRKEQERGSYPASALLAGIHLEGPFLNPLKKGAQKEDFLRLPDPALLSRLQEASEGLIRLVTLAPELEGALECIRAIRELRFPDRPLMPSRGKIPSFSGKITCSVGHTAADYHTALRAFQAGADHVTHLYNAMPPFHHRKPSLIDAAMDCEHVFVELICDGVHSSPSAVRAAFRLFPGRLVLISDSLEAAGLGSGRFRLGGQDVSVTDGRALLPDGTLAGSVSNLYDCLRKAVSFGIPLEQAAAAATINPCRSVGLDQVLGSIEPGKAAHFLLLDQKDLAVRAVIRDGLILRSGR